MLIKAMINILIIMGTLSISYSQEPDFNEFWKDFKTNLLTGNYHELKVLMPDTLIYGMGGDGCYSYEDISKNSDWDKVTEVFTQLMDDINNKSVYTTTEILPEETSLKEFFFAYCPPEDSVDPKVDNGSNPELKRLQSILESDKMIKVIFSFSIIGYNEETDGGPGGFSFYLTFGLRGNHYYYIGMTNGA